MESFNEIRTTRRADARTERIFIEYHKRHLYPILGIHHFSMVEDVNAQLAGADVITKNEKGTEFVFDEKGSAHYFNTLKTNAIVELESSINTNVDPFGTPTYEPVTGWFLNDNLKTQYYTFYWGYLNTEKFPFVYDKFSSTKYFKTVAGIEDITATFAIVVNKQKVRNWFKQKCWSKDMLFDKALRLWYNDKRPGVHFSTVLSPLRKYGVVGICISNNLRERPVVIVLSQEFFISQGLVERFIFTTSQGISVVGNGDYLKRFKNHFELPFFDVKGIDINKARETLVGYDSV